jgi:hypothetical protein
MRNCLPGAGRRSCPCRTSGGIAEDRRDCYWLYVVTNCGPKVKLEYPIKDPPASSGIKLPRWPTTTCWWMPSRNRCKCGKSLHGMERTYEK